MKLISRRAAEKYIEEYTSWIKEVADRYRMPPALIKAMLYKEMTEIDLMDVAADLAVLMHLRGKRDSSTGFAQIFGYVGVNAINFAVDRGLATYEQLGFAPGHRLDPQAPADVREVWLRLFRDRKANIEIAALNLLAAAEEMTGRLHFPDYSEEELKLILTRYNANVRHVTPYGEEAYRHYLRYLQQESPG